MRRLLSWILTPLHLIALVGVLLIFHPIQMVARRCGYHIHKTSVDFIQLTLMLSLKIIGAKISMTCSHQIPQDLPLILVLNHQSMYDIPLIGWFFRKNHPKYIAKVELRRGLPSVSYNLRHGGSILIDRSDVKQSLNEIEKLGKYIEENKYAACIFPEGTRARDGKMKSFKAAGFLKLLQAAPSAVVVPIAIDGSWKLMQHKFLPMPVGVHLAFTALEPIMQDGRSGSDILKLAEAQIRTQLRQEHIAAAA